MDEAYGVCHSPYPIYIHPFMQDLDVNFNMVTLRLILQNVLALS